MKTALIVATLVAGIAGTAAAQGGQRGQADPRNRGGGNCSANPYNCADTPNPLTPPDTVWMEDMTWMDVRDAVKAGKTTVIIATRRSKRCSPTWRAATRRTASTRSSSSATAAAIRQA